MNELLTCEGLTKSYQKGTNALDDIELHIGFGRIVGLLGPNGSGKTTLIKLANGLLQPTAGSIKIAGMDPGPDTKAIVSYLPDAAWLPDWMRVEQLVEMFRDFYADFDPAKANEMLEKLELSPKAPLKSLSKGNKEKVQLILAMSRNARLYLLDEPIGGVDPAARDYILNTILTNYSRDASVIISTHLIEDVEPVLPLRGGKITGEDVHDGGLAGTVRPQQAVDDAVLHRERDVVHCKAAAVFPGEVGYFYHKKHSFSAGVPGNICIILARKCVRNKINLCAFPNIVSFALIRQFSRPDAKRAPLPAKGTTLLETL